MKALFFTDTHFRDRKPINRIDDFYDVQLKKLEYVLNMCEDEKINYVFFGGDWFDGPEPSYKLYNDIVKILKIYKNLEIYSIIGSHDVFGYDYGTLDRTALGALVNNDLIHILKERAFGDTFIKGISCAKNLDIKEFKLRTDFKNKIIMVHYEISPDPLPFECLLTKDIEKVTNANLILCGHIHHPFKDGIFVNPGCLVRQKSDEEDIEPGVAIFEV